MVPGMASKLQKVLEPYETLRCKELGPSNFKHDSS